MGRDTSAAVKGVLDPVAAQSGLIGSPSESDVDAAYAARVDALARDYGLTARECEVPDCLGRGYNASSTARRSSSRATPCAPTCTTFTASWGSPPSAT